jgi:hypothetical protein
MTSDEGAYALDHRAMPDAGLRLPQRRTKRER